MVDAGSGLLDETTPWLDATAAVAARRTGRAPGLDAGATLVTFSGDKLLGGPQAGIIVGTADAVATIARHPLARAMRADKLTLALLAVGRVAYLSGDATAIPLWRMATTPVDDAARPGRGDRRARCPALEVVDTEAVAGGGSLPGLTIPSIGVAVDRRRSATRSAHGCATRGVVARVDDGRARVRPAHGRPATTTCLARWRRCRASCG